MTADQIRTLRASWTTLAPKALIFVDVLYEEFFAEEPHLRILFEGGMDEQHRKLTFFIAHAVERIDQPALRQTLLDLGARHRRFGVEPRHFEALGDAWVRALERVPDWKVTEEVVDAWRAFYSHLSSTMQEGAELKQVPL